VLSYSTGKHGKGWVYGVNTALDETGATLGPIIMGFSLFLGATYRTGYALLLGSTLLALAALVRARLVFPVPARLEEGGPATAHAKGFTTAYWLYMVGGTCFAAGLMSFELVSFHLASTGAFASHWIPVLLALATVGAIAASLVFGRMYDRVGIGAVIAAAFASSLFSPLVFFGGLGLMIVGLLLWGVGYATQDTLMKALIASVLPEGRRNLAFGVFYLGYGSGWLVGSIATGVLYEHSRVGLVAFAAAAQLASIPFFLAGAGAARKV
jgi:predicted MFS family arabinose efflux permease